MDFKVLKTFRFISYYKQLPVNSVFIDISGFVPNLSV